MSGVQPKQLWVSPEPETYYVLGVLNDKAKVVPVRIEGKGASAKVIRKGPVREVLSNEMLNLWMPTVHEPKPAPTWHEHLLNTTEDEV